MLEKCLPVNCLTLRNPQELKTQQLEQDCSHTLVSLEQSQHDLRQRMTNDEIAEQLYIAPTTVKTHQRNIRKKLGLAGAKNRLPTCFKTSKSNYQNLYW